MRSNTNNLFESFNNYQNINKPLKEDVNADDIELYMNTWGNYNEYGADADKINGGWMSVEKAKEFLDAHKEEEPFINDTENVPEALDIDEYSNPWTAIEQIEFVQGVDDTDAFLAILEDQGDFESAKDIYESGDFTFFPGVDNDFDLGKAWFDMVGGVNGIQNPQNYVNREYVKDAIVADLGSDEDYSDDEIDDMVEEEIELAADSKNEAFFDNYFDYEALGRDLDYDGFFFAETGALQTY